MAAVTGFAPLPDGRGSVRALLMFVVMLPAAAQNAPATEKHLTLMGRRATVVVPELIVDGFDAKGEASICLDPPPEHQCYVAPKGYGRSPQAEDVRLDKNTSAILFSVDSGGVSGWSVHFALLRPGSRKELENLLPSQFAISSQSQHAFWDEPSLSDARILVTADYVWDRQESHFSDHRYIISAYTLELDRELERRQYSLEDRYMTVRKYSPEDSGILKAERAEILARLKRVKDSRKR